MTPGHCAFQGVWVLQGVYPIRVILTRLPGPSRVFRSSPKLDKMLHQRDGAFSRRPTHEAAKKLVLRLLFVDELCSRGVESLEHLHIRHILHYASECFAPCFVFSTHRFKDNV